MIRLAAILSLCATSLLANPCLHKSHLEAFLKQEHDMRLHSWGLNREGHMLELWLAPDGLFAVVTTTPAKCSTVELPHDLKGRLWIPPSPNWAIPEANRMNQGKES